MLKSMTGFGRGEASNSETTVVVEIKSVNNRFRDINVKAPREYLQLESRVISKIKSTFSRGRVDVYIRRTGVNGAVVVETNKRLAQSLMNAARDIFCIEDKDLIEVVLTYPGVISASSAAIDPTAEWEVIEPALDGAINQLAEMRETEGASAHQDLQRHHLDLITEVAGVEEFSHDISERLYDRLVKRIHLLLKEEVDPNRLHQEAAILADKADISEELSRMKSHCRQFESALSSDEPVGRRLDFLTQEMNREVNTISSKTVDHPIRARVIDMKSILEKIKEQAANIE